jgi:hypothetical protein
MDCSWSIIVLNFEFLLVLNYDDVIWDCPKKEDLGKRSHKHRLEEVRIIVGTL